MVGSRGEGRPGGYVMARVYISSTIADLKRERQVVTDWLVAARHEVVHSYRPDSDTVRDSCLADVDTCDLYVLILGHRYGPKPADSNPQGLSITHLEFRRAGQSRKPRIALLRTSIPDVSLSEMEDPQKAALVLAFREEVTREVRPALFHDESGLIQGLSTGVQAELAKRSAGPGPRIVVPAQLPHSISDFTGREAEIKMLNALLPGDGADAGGPIIIAAITGMAGVGKSALAVHWSHQIRDRFPDGQLYVNLRGFDPAGQAMDPANAVRGFLDVFAVPPERIPVDLDEQGALYRSILADLRVLILLDNARDGRQVRLLLPGSPGCLVVVTSRSQLIGLAATDAAHSVSIDLLPSHEARRLLTRRLGPERVAAEPAAVNEIIRACAGLPLALSIVAARAAANPRLLLAGLAHELRETRGLDALDGGDTRTNVRTVFSWSYRALSASAARLFRLLGMHAGPDIGVLAAASLAGEASARTRALLIELTRAHLLTQQSRGRFAFHDLLRAYSRELGDTPDSAAERRAALHRVLDHYLYTAYRADELLRPNREETLGLIPAVEGVTPQKLSDHRKALSWFDTEYQVLLAALRQAVSEGFDVHTWQLAWALTSFFDRQCHWHDAVASQQAALDAANRLGDLYGQAVSHVSLANAYTRLGRHEAAKSHLEKAVHLYEELEDKTGQAQAHRSIAWVFEQMGECREALPYAQRALELSRAAGQRTGQARALNAIGWFHLQLGAPEEALVHCQLALALHKEIEDQIWQANTLDSIASAYHRLGSYEEAAAYYRQALDLYRDFGDRYNEADAWACLGDTYFAAGDPVSADAAWRNALAILDDLGHPDAAQVRMKLKR
jgi:tetratricopeptide (TPR) repeat protein